MSKADKMYVVKKLVNETVNDFLLQIKQSLENNDYYIESSHRSLAPFGILNSINDEVLEQAEGMHRLEFFIRMYLINPILFALFQIHGVTPHEAEKSKINKKNGFLVGADNKQYEQYYFYQMTFLGKNLLPYALKYTEEALFDHRFRRHGLLFNKIYIIDWNLDGNSSNRMFFHKPKSRFEKKVEIISLLDLFEMYFTKDEYDYCLEKMRDAITKAIKLTGFDSIHMLTPRYMHEIKKTIKNALLSWDLINRQYHFVQYDNRVHGEVTVDKSILPSELDDIDVIRDTKTIITNCFASRRYETLIGNGEYAKCFITSEYLCELFNKGEYKIEYTAIACGYFKCVEQLVYRIVRIFLESGQYSSEIIKGVPKKYKKIPKQYQEEVKQMHNAKILPEDKLPFRIEYENGFDIMLNPLIFFIEHVASFWDVSSNTQKHVCKLLHNYADHCRNEHFHKDNIFDINAIKSIRENTITLSLLLLGSIKLPDGINEKESLFIYDDNYDRLVEILMKTRGPWIYYLKFENETIMAHRHIKQKPIEIDEDGKLSVNEFVFVPVSGTYEIAQNLENEEYDDWFEKKPKIIISKDNYPSKVWYETRGKEKKQVLIWSTN